MNVEKISVAITPEMAAMLRAAVESGDYASTSEVIRDALRMWKTREEAMARRTEELRRLWQEGLDSGPAVDGPETFARLRQRIAAAESEGDEAAAAE